MPPLVFLAVVGAGCYAGYKLFSKLVEQAQTPVRKSNDAARREAAADNEARDLGELEFDATTGVYRPKKQIR